MIRNLKWWFVDNWQLIGLGAVLFISVVFAYTFNLGGLTSGLSTPEIIYLKNTVSLGQILADPTFLPHKIMTFVAQSVTSNPAIVRLPSVLISIFTLLISVLFLRRTYSTRTVFLASVVIISSSWLLTLGRLALPEISYIMWAPLICIYGWIHQYISKEKALLILALVIGTAIYTPGYIWFIAVFVFLERKRINDFIRSSRVWVQIMSGVILFTMLLPMIRASILNPSNLLALAGLPDSLSTISKIPMNLIQTFSELIFYSNKSAVYTIGNLPFLDYFSIILLGVGLYAQRYTDKKWRFIALFGILFSILLISIGGLVTSTILIPVIYFYIAAGIAFLLTQWFTVFPYNPILKAVGTTLMTISVLVIAFYHVNRYYIAWPGTPETRKQFGHSLLK